MIKYYHINNTISIENKIIILILFEEVPFIVLISSCSSSYFLKICLSTFDNC